MRNTHACQAKHRPGCTLHAALNTDLCPSCLKAEPVPRITRPVFDRNGQRISNGPSELTTRLRAQIAKLEPAEINF